MLPRLHIPIFSPWMTCLLLGMAMTGHSLAVPPVFTSVDPRGIYGIQNTAISPWSIPVSGTVSRYWASGLPPGLVLDSSSGIISGAPLVTGSYQVIVGASNPDGSTVPVQVEGVFYPAGGNPPGKIYVSAYDLVNYPAEVSVSGTDESSQLILGPLPAGMSYTPPSNYVPGSDFVLAGYPTVAGHYPVDVKVTNVYGSSQAVPSPIFTRSPSTWTRQAIGSNTYLGISDVAYGNGIYVAVGDLSLAGVIYTSPDLKKWTAQNAGTAGSIWRVFFANGRFLVTDYYGTILCSADGITWTATSTGSTVSAFAYGAGIYVAVGGTSKIQTSSDGVTWNPVPGLTASIAPSDLVFDGTRFVGVGSAGLVVTSADGINWSVKPAPTTNHFSRIAAGNGRLVAGFSSVKGVLVSSDGGDSWQPSSAPPDFFSPLLCFGGGLFLAASSSTDFYTSADGMNWQREVYGEWADGKGMYAQGKFLFGSTVNTIIYTDPSRWVPVTEPMPTTEVTLGSPVDCQIASTHSPTQYSAYNLPSGLSLNQTTGRLTGIPATAGSYEISVSARNAAGPGNLVTFTLRVFAPTGPRPVITRSGSSWDEYPVQQSVGFTREFLLSNLDLNSVVNVTGLPSGVTWSLVDVYGTNAKVRISDPSTDSGTFPVTISVSNVYGEETFTVSLEIWDSPLRWTAGPALSTVAFGNGVFVGVEGLTMKTSPDGLVWTSTSLPGIPGQGITSLEFANGLFIVLGSDGILMTSPDGLNWTRRTSGVTSILRKVAYGNSTFVVTGDTGVVLTSPDGVLWTRQNSGVTDTLSHLTFGNGKFLAAGKVPLSSVDGTVWQPVVLPITSNFFTSVLKFGNGVFLLTIPNYNLISSDGEVWEIVDSAGWTSPVQFCEGSFYSPSFNGIKTSQDGLEWVNIPKPATPASITPGKIAIGNGLAVMTYTSGIVNGYLRAVGWPPSIKSSTSLACIIGQPMEYFIQATNGATHFSSTTLPPGLQLDPSSGKISGTPDGAATYYYFWVFAGNAAGRSEPKQISLQYLPEEGELPVFSSSPTATGIFGKDFYYKIEAQGTDLGTTFFVDNLPAGLRFNPVDRTIRGRASEPGISSALIGVTTLRGTVSQSLIISISDPAWRLKLVCPYPFAGTRLLGFSGGIFYAVPWTDDGRGLFSSPDGDTWSAVPVSGLEWWEDLNNLSLFLQGGATKVAVGSDGQTVVSEGSGGWRRVRSAVSGVSTTSGAYGNSTFLLLTTSGIQTSTDGLTWVDRGHAAEGKVLEKVVFFNGLFVAMGQGRTVFSSPDGVNWTKCFDGSALSGYFTAIAALNGKVHVFTDSGFAMVSQNLAEWVQKPLPGSFRVESAAFGNGGYAIAGAYGIYTSFDGEYWVGNGVEGDQSSTTHSRVVFGNGIFLADGSPVNGSLVRSTGFAPLLFHPGSLESSAGASFFYQIVAHGNPSRFVVAGLPAGLTYDASTGIISGNPSASGDFRVSVTSVNAAGNPSNMLTIALRIHPAIGPLPILLSKPVISAAVAGAGVSYALNLANLDATSTIAVTGLPGGLSYSAATKEIRGTTTVAGTSMVNIRATNRYGESNFPIEIISGEVSWELGGTGASVGTLSLAAYGNNTCIGMTYSGKVFLSPDGFSWNLAVQIPSFTPAAVTFANGQFVAVGASGKIFTSADGSTWTERVSGTTRGLSDVEFANGQFLAVGSNGTLLTSPDGVTWASRASGVTNSFTCVAYGSGKYLIGGSKIIRSSTDLVTWSTIGTGNSFFPYDLIFDRGLFVAAMQDCTIRTSSDGGSWTTRFTAPATDNFQSLSSGNGFYVASSIEGVRYSTDGLNWKSSFERSGITMGRVEFLNSTFLGLTKQSSTIRGSRPDAPSFTCASTAQGVIGQPLTFSVTATNPQQTFSATSLPPGTAINASTGVITGSPAQTGHFEAVIVAANTAGQDTLHLEFDVFDSLPLLPADEQISAILGSWFVRDLAEPLAPENLASAQGLPPGLALDPDTGKIYGIPSKAGKFWSRITISNPLGSRSEVLHFTVNYPAPVIIAQPDDQLVEEGATIILQASAAGGGNITYQWRKSGVPLMDSQSISGSQQPSFPTNYLASTAAGSYDFTATNESASSVISGSQQPRLTITNVGSTAAGSYDLVATNESGSSVTRAAAVRTVRTFSTWASGRALPSGQAGALDDPEFPGISNLIVYTLGIPKVGNAADYLPTIEEQAGGLVYKFRTSDAVIDVNFVVQTSADLVSWTTAGVVLRMVDHSGGYEHWEASVAAPAKSRFFRLVVGSSLPLP